MAAIKNFIESIPKEEFDRKNQEQLEQTKKDYDEFKKKFEKGECSFCYKKLNDTDGQSCLHWLLAPKKKKLQTLLISSKKYGFFQIQTYLRWVANLESPLLNINNLEDEISKEKMVELTIKYKNIQWSFSIAPNDYLGHKDKQIDFPHFHMRIEKDGYEVWSFQNHIHLSTEDLFWFQAMKEIPNLELRTPFGESVQDVFDRLTPEEIIDRVKPTDDYEKESIHLSTMIFADDGKSITGEELAEIMKEVKKTNKPMSVIATEKIGHKTKIITEITPGEGIPQITKRTIHKSR